MGSYLTNNLELAKQRIISKLKEITSETKSETIIEATNKDINDKTLEKATSTTNNYTMQEYTQSNYYYLKLIMKWKLHFLIITIAATVLAALFSSELFIPSKFKSFAIVYPSNLTPYGQESPTEQMMQLFESADIRNAIIKKFNLAKRYEIDTSAKSGKSTLIATYQSNVTISRTQFESIEVKVLDTDPIVACEMVKEIIKALNLKARSLQRDKTKEVLVVLTNELNYKKHQLDSLNTRLNEIRTNYHILDYKTQSKEVIKGYVKGLVKNKDNKDITEMMHNLEEKGGEFYGGIKIYEELLKGYSAIKLQFDEVLKDMNKELTYTNMVTYPTPSDKKAYPIRSLIVLVSVVSANMFLFVVLVLIDSRRKIVL